MGVSSTPDPPDADTPIDEHESTDVKSLPFPYPGYIQVGVWIVAGIIFGVIVALNEPIETSIVAGIIAGMIVGSVARAAAESINKFSQE